MRRGIVTILCIGIVILLILFIPQRFYNPRNVSTGMINRAEQQYQLPMSVLQPILSSLQHSFLYIDSPSCGFDERYELLLLNEAGQTVSHLYIAQDGCGIFNVSNTNQYIEGEEEVRVLIEAYIKEAIEDGHLIETV